MKKIFTLICLLSVAGFACINATRYATPNTKGKYSFEKLSTIEGSGVSKSGNVYTIATDTLEISQADTLVMDNNSVVKLGNKAVILIYGHGDLTPVDTATITRASEDAKPFGVCVRGDFGSAEIKNISFEYSSLRYMSSYKPLNISHSAFIKAFSSSFSNSGVISFITASGGHKINDCRFIENDVCALGGGANYPTGMSVRNCYFYDNNIANSNKPQINITVGGDNPIEIVGNTVIGNKRTKVGGIGVSNMLNLGGAHKVLIEDNYVTLCRYGFTAIGVMDVRIINNKFVDNKYDTNPMNGGSGVSLYDSTKKQKSYIEGNLIEGNFWGITVIGTDNVNAGKIDDKSATDYNPGNNVFKDNGNSDSSGNFVLYDLYNNTTSNTYAQGNTWNVATQDAASIETVIFHKVDNASLGEVYYMPGAGVETVNADNAVKYANGVVSVSNEVEIMVYDASGKIVKASNGKVVELNVSALANGFYIVKAGNAVIRFAK